MPILPFIRGTKTPAGRGQYADFSYGGITRIRFKGSAFLPSQPFFGAPDSICYDYL
jgi:hypothetical protein